MKSKRREYCRPSLGLGHTARADILERDVWGAVKSQKSKRRNHCNGYCWPSLGLGNPAMAGILQGDVWGALPIEHYVLEP